MIYFIIYSLFVIASFSEIFLHKRGGKLLIIYLLGLVCIVVSGLRWRTGTDWIPYYSFFTEYTSLVDFLQTPRELGFVIFNFAIKNLINSYTFFLFVTAALVIYLKFNTIIRLSKYPSTVLLANASLYAIDLFTVRQGIAIAITLFSIRYIFEKEKWKFLLFVLIATSFHATAIVFLSAYKIFHSKVTRNKIFIGLLVGFLFSIFVNMESVLIYVTSKISPNLHFLAEAYSELDREVASDIPLWVRKFLQFSKGFLILLLFGWAIKLRTSSFFIDGIFKIYATYVFVLVLFSNAHPVFLRFGMYFSVVEIFIFPVIISAFKTRSKRLVAWFFVFAYLMSKFIYGFLGNWDLFFPYETIFDNSYKEVY